MSRSPQTRHLRASDLATSSSAIGQPAFGQVYNLSPVDIAAGQPAPIGQTPEEISFENLLTKIISASPDRRTKSKQKLVKLGKTGFGLSEKRAGTLREQVIDRLGASAWSDPGRPRR